MIGQTNTAKKMELLRLLRADFYEGAEDNTKRDLNLVLAADVLDVPAKIVRGYLREMLELGWIKPTGQSPALAFTDGRCEITAEGLRVLSEHDARVDAEMDAVDRLLEKLAEDAGAATGQAPVVGFAPPAPNIPSLPSGQGAERRH